MKNWLRYAVAGCRLKKDETTSTQSWKSSDKVEWYPTGGFVFIDPASITAVADSQGEGCGAAVIFCPGATGANTVTVMRSATEVIADIQSALAN